MEKSYQVKRDITEAQSSRYIVVDERGNEFSMHETASDARAAIKRYEMADKQRAY